MSRDSLSTINFEKTGSQVARRASTYTDSSLQVTEENNMNVPRVHSVRWSRPRGEPWRVVSRTALVWLTVPRSNSNTSRCRSRIPEGRLESFLASIALPFLQTATECCVWIKHGLHFKEHHHIRDTQILTHQSGWFLLWNHSSYGRLLSETSSQNLKRQEWTLFRRIESYLAILVHRRAAESERFSLVFRSKSTTLYADEKNCSLRSSVFQRSPWLAKLSV